VELAVLVKAVPRSEALRYDPSRRALVRAGAELVLNPFDQRALRVALELRRPGDRVAAVSLGPASAGPLLREARAMGVDRALHLCADAFAGSDVLATSAALASALTQLSPGLVLAGSSSTDSDTGLVGPEVAGRLGIPVVTRARSIRRAEAPTRIEVDVDTPTGWGTVAVDLPALVTVGEKIAKPLFITPEQFAGTPEGSVEVVGPSELGLSVAEVGAFGSPTSVEAVREASPRRLGRTFGAGPVPERVREAVSTLASRLERAPVGVPPLPWPPPEDVDHEVGVLGTGPQGEVERAVLGILTHLRHALAGYTVSAVTYGPALDAVQRGRLEAAGALGGYVLDPGGAPFDSGDVAQGLSSLLDHRPKLASLVLPASSFGREVAGQFAASRGLGAVGDALDVQAAPRGELEWSKPSFGGGRIASIRCRSRPVVATFSGGVAVPATDARAHRAVDWTVVAAPHPKGRVIRLTDHAEPFAGEGVDTAEVVVAVGTGVGGPEGIERLLPTVRRWNAALVGTRRVVDAGWLPPRRQVGLTGRFLAPRLAVLLGIRGALNHMVGWARAGSILAVNRDATAPVFGWADAGIVGTVDEVVPELAEPVARVVQGAPNG